MVFDKKEYEISEDLQNITEREINILDQENTNGESWDYYCRGQIVKAAVLRDTITGSARELVEEYEMKVTADEHQFFSSCTCGSRDKLCKHVISLLYSWINDREDFINVGKAVEKLFLMDKGELINIIERILKKDPSKVKFVKRFDEEDEEIDADDYLKSFD